MKRISERWHWFEPCLAFYYLMAATRGPGLIHPTYFLVFNSSTSVSSRELSESMGWAKLPLEMLLMCCGARGDNAFNEESQLIACTLLE